MSSLPHLVLGTSGHVDHGKTTLVQALTGIDTDRLAEEKRRGITIDLGFAHMELESIRIAFVDVPGHERFVHNMLAGISGLDAVILVIAADEGVMPQPREHLHICRLLGVQQGLLVLTRCDKVDDPEMLDLCADEVRELVKDTFLAEAPLLRTSAKTGEGLDELRNALLQIASETHRTNSDRSFRLDGSVFRHQGIWNCCHRNRSQREPETGRRSVAMATTTSTAYTQSSGSWNPVNNLGWRTSRNQLSQISLKKSSGVINWQPLTPC